MSVIRFAPFLIILFVTGCAFQPMSVKLAPDTTVTANDIGYGRTIYLSVHDERPVKEVGHRGSAFMKGASITLDEELSATVQTSLAKMLQSKGFSVVYDNAKMSDSALRVDIRGLDYSTSTGFWTGGVQVAAAVKARAESDIENYEQFYRYDNEDRVVFVPGADSNSQRINAALSDVLHQLVSDRKLLEVLARH